MKAIIFDLDGVVVDTAKYHYLAWRKLAQELGFTFEKMHNERLKGVSRMRSLEIVLEVGGITGVSEEKKQELAERKNGYYLEMISGINQSEILPGITEFISRKKKAGYKIGLGSASKSGGMILEKLGLAGQFDVIVDGNLVERAKPDPQVFTKAAELLGVPCSQCIVIEDAAAGIDAAIAGGMKCIGVGARDILKKADIVVPDTEALLSI
ncbi:MAG: beta-phosphoglucomutase [Lachnospiraceae bacterium]|nr:beta-phosphoglucomutase [Lachnospiraceae bacterium]